MSKLRIEVAQVFEPFLKPSRYKGVFGGRGCVFGDTLLDTPSGRIKIKDFKGGGVYSLRGGRVTIENASLPVEYSPVDLYKVMFSDGRYIICTDQHKFLTGRGWITLAHLTKSDVFCGVLYRSSFFHRLTNWGNALPAFFSSVRRWKKKGVGFLSRCFEYPRQYGPQPQFLLNTGLSTAPLRGGVERRSPRVLICSDGQHTEHSYNPLWFFYPPSILGAAPSGEGGCCVGSESESAGKSFVSPLATCRRFLLFHARTFLAWLAVQLCELGPAAYFLLRLIQIPQTLFGTLWRVVSGSPYKTPLAPNLIIGNVTKLRQVCKHSRQSFWDLSVPSTGCYFANGLIHHNSGKSHFFGEHTISEHILYPGLRTLCIREIQKSLKESMKQLLEDKIRKLGVSSMFNVLQTEIQTPGDGIIIFQGMQDHTADSIKSFENFNRSLCEEAHTLSKKSIELLRPTIRNAGPAPMAERRFIWNPRSASDPADSLLRGLNPPPDSILIRANYMDNPWFPDDMEKERQHDYDNNPDRYAHIWLGEYEPQAVGAIFSRQIIHENRRAAMSCERERTVIAVDPAVTSPETNASGNPDEHGIVVCALGADQRGYLLEDGSMHGAPHQWATRAVALYDKWDADAIVIEKNQGGDMCRYTLETVRKGIRIIEVTATRGKHVRAEPISALYSLGSISHVGTFPEIENQLCLFTSSGYNGDKSPDRAEATIWGFTELFPKLTTEKAADPVQPYYGEGGWMG